jgi:hypothetical protein
VSGSDPDPVCRSDEAIVCKDSSALLLEDLYRSVRPPSLQDPCQPSVAQANPLPLRAFAFLIADNALSKLGSKIVLVTSLLVLRVLQSVYLWEQKGVLDIAVLGLLLWWQASGHM